MQYLAPQIPDREILAKAKLFNAWRREHDYPRIVDYFLSTNEYLQGWMDEFEISKKDMLNLGPSNFLGGYPFRILRRGNGEIESVWNGLFQSTLYPLEVASDDLKKHGRFFNVTGEGTLVPSFWEWVKSKNSLVAAKRVKYHPRGEIVHCVKTGADGSYLGDLQLLDIRGVLPKNYLIERDLDLDFCDFRGCVLDVGFARKYWFCDFRGAIFDGDFDLINMHACLFGKDEWNGRHTQFRRGNFNQWHITDSEVNAFFDECNLNNWELENTSFGGVFKNVTPDNVDVKNNGLLSGLDYSKSCRCLKRLYSEVFDFEMASEMHIKEKRGMCVEYVESSKRALYRYKCGKPKLSDYLSDEGHLCSRGKIGARVDWVKDYLKYVVNPLTQWARFEYLIKSNRSKLNYRFWGYGERPSFIFGWAALFVFIIFPIVYFWVGPESAVSVGVTKEGTRGLVVNSLYFSMVTFSTLGYGDITPGLSYFVKLVCGFEGLFGVFCMTLAISSYISKSIK